MAILTRKCRVTGTLIGLYKDDFEADPELPWTTVCEEHNTLVSHPSKALALAAMSFPEWCEECQPIIDLYRQEHPRKEFIPASQEQINSLEELLGKARERGLMHLPAMKKAENMLENKEV